MRMNHLRNLKLVGTAAVILALVCFGFTRMAGAQASLLITTRGVITSVTCDDPDCILRTLTLTTAGGQETFLVSSEGTVVYIATEKIETSKLDQFVNTPAIVLSQAWETQRVAGLINILVFPVTGIIGPVAPGPNGEDVGGGTGGGNTGGGNTGGGNTGGGNTGGGNTGGGNTGGGNTGGGNTGGGNTGGGNTGGGNTGGGNTGGGNTGGGNTGGGNGGHAEGGNSGHKDNNKHGQGGGTGGSGGPTGDNGNGHGNNAHDKH